MSTYVVIGTFVDECKTFDTADGAIRHALRMSMNHYRYTIIDGIAATDHDVARADAKEWAITHPTQPTVRRVWNGEPEF